MKKVQVKSFKEMADILEQDQQCNLDRGISVQELADTVALLHASLIAICRELHKKEGI